MAAQTGNRPDGKTLIAPDPAGLGERFMAAFNDIEHRIRETGRPKDSLSQLSRDFFTRRGLAFHIDAFSDFVDLRNTLAHGRHFRGALLATPAPEVVAEVEALRELVVSPPRAVDVLGRQQIVTCAIDDDLDAVLPLMAEHGYSQIPVHDTKGRHVGLLTPQALARWLADSWRVQERVRSVPVSEILAYAKDSERARFLTTAATVADVVEALTGDATHPRVPAVLLTPDGSTRQAIVAIATAGDLPRLVEVLALN